MAFFLSYAFGKRGRHWRKTLADTHAFMRLKASRLRDEPSQCFVWAHYLSTLGVLTRIFFPDNETDSFYALHEKYGQAVLHLTPQSLLKLVAAYHFGATMTIDCPKPQSVESGLAVTQKLAFVYDCDEEYLNRWMTLLIGGDANLASAQVCSELGQALGVSDSQKVMADWVPLVGVIRNSTSTVLMNPTFTNQVKAVIENGF